MLLFSFSNLTLAALSFNPHSIISITPLLFITLFSFWGQICFEVLFMFGSHLPIQLITTYCQLCPTSITYGKKSTMFVKNFGKQSSSISSTSNILWPNYFIRTLDLINNSKCKQKHICKRCFNPVPHWLWNKIEQKIILNNQSDWINFWNIQWCKHHMYDLYVTEEY